jgi:salicylate hydroxylase
MPGLISPPILRVAIIGGGPGGLSSAIALSKLDNVEVTIYEKAKELREIGAGINIGYNCWKVLELLGAADGVKGHVSELVLQRYLALILSHLKTSWLTLLATGSLEQQWVNAFRRQ